MEQVEQAFHDMKAAWCQCSAYTFADWQIHERPCFCHISSMNRLDKLVSLRKQKTFTWTLQVWDVTKKSDTPLWYDRLPERERWAVQARFWNAIARRWAKSPAVFLHNLNERTCGAGKGRDRRQCWRSGHVGEASWHPKAWVDNRMLCRRI